MKLGCAVGTFTHPHYDPPYERAIERIADLGFQGVELIAFRREDLSEYYSATRIKSLRDRLENRNLQLSEFILYNAVVAGLVSEDGNQRQQAFDAVARGIEIARELGTRMLNMVSNWPAELQAPASYLPSYIHPYVPGIERFEPVLRMDLPRNFAAEALWARYMDSLRVVVEMVEKADMSFLLEGHANVIVGTTDAMLRAFDWIKSPHFGTNFDTAWQLLQREYLPWSVYKLGSRIRHVHLRDGDGLLCYALPPGRGVIDWHGFVRALKDVSFTGFLSFELGGMERTERYVREAKRFMEEVLQEEGALD